MPDDEEKMRLLALAGEADEGDSYYKKRMQKKAKQSKMAQFQAPPQREMALESIEKAVKERKEPFMLGGKTPREDYYNPSGEEGDFVTDIRSGMKRRKEHLISDPTWGWEASDYKEERELAENVLKSFKDAFSYGHSRGIQEQRTPLHRIYSRSLPSEMFGTSPRARLFLRDSEEKETDMDVDAGINVLRDSWSTSTDELGTGSRLSDHSDWKESRRIWDGDSVKEHKMLRNKYDYRTYLKLLAKKYQDEAAEMEKLRSTSEGRKSLRMQRGGRK